MKQEDPAIVLCKRSLRLKDAIHHHILVYGWPEVTKVLREEIFVHVSWHSEFTELDNVLQKIGRNYKSASSFPPHPARAYRSDIPN